MPAVANVDVIDVVFFTKGRVVVCKVRMAGVL